MAGRDYGAIVKKNGELVNWELYKYPSMFHCVGFSIDSLDYEYENSIGEVEIGNQEIDSHYFYYVGDRDCVVAVYKDFLTVIIDGKLVSGNVIVRPKVWFEGIASNVMYFENGLRIEIRRVDDGPRMCASFDYKDDQYEILYGYGISNEGSGLQFDADDRTVEYVKNFINE